MAPTPLDFDLQAFDKVVSGQVGVAMASQDDIFTIKELSEHLRVHPTTIYRLLRQGLLPGFRVGSNWRFNRAAIEQWERTQASSEQVIVPRGRRKRQPEPRQ